MHCLKQIHPFQLKLRESILILFQFIGISVAWPSRSRKSSEDRIYHAIVAAPQDLERMLDDTQETIVRALRGKRDVRIVLDKRNMNFVSQSDIGKRQGFTMLNEA